MGFAKLFNDELTLDNISRLNFYSLNKVMFDNNFDLVFCFLKIVLVYSDFFTMVFTFIQKIFELFSKFQNPKTTIF